MASAMVASVSRAATPPSTNTGLSKLRRLEEERKRLDEEINAFHEHMRNLRMARDREEFDRFMRDRGSNRPNYGYTDGNNNNGTQI